jgi:IS30 family transposase
MARRLALTDEQRSALKKFLDDDRPYTEMAQHLNVCVDTLKRILHREGLFEFEGAKYAVSPSNRLNQETWCRPCLKCKDDSPRPKWVYVCAKCKLANDNLYSGVDDDWLRE